MTQADSTKADKNPAEILAYKTFVLTVLGIAGYVAAVIYFIG